MGASALRLQLIHHNILSFTVHLDAPQCQRGAGRHVVVQPGRRKALALDADGEGAARCRLVRVAGYCPRAVCDDTLPLQPLSGCVITDFMSS